VSVIPPGPAGLAAAAYAADLLAAAWPRTTVRLGRTSSSGQVRVEEVELDEYVAQVVSGEGQPRAGEAAQQALAIAARTYVLANRGRHRDAGFDVCDSTHCQVVRPATGPTRRAASATSGRVLLRDGRVASVFHSAWCGGHPERASDVWPGAGSGPVAAADEACAGEPGWTSEVRASDLERALRAAGLRGDRLSDLRIVQRTRSGRVARVRVEGFSPREMGGEAFRTAVGRTLGWQLLKSTLFELDRTSGGYRFVGQGFGHGVGLCVLGAGRRAARGATVESILRFYFPNETLGSVPPVGEIALSVPAFDESERDVLISMIRASRDDIAAQAGVDTPPHIRVTVHPTVESFSRATGQPSFVASAAQGTQIDVIPLAFLRRQGPLDRVLRHELAHVLLDARLAQRPLWVREGAARVFSAQTTVATGLPATRPRPCPTDAELRQPGSAQALRDAYERAEACFRHALADGTPWHQIR
jgi:stage II sporulation protein D